MWITLPSTKLGNLPNPRSLDVHSTDDSRLNHTVDPSGHADVRTEKPTVRESDMVRDEKWLCHDHIGDDGGRTEIAGTTHECLRNDRRSHHDGKCRHHTDRRRDWLGNGLHGHLRDRS